jgi:hypothetical protein
VEANLNLLHQIWVFTMATSVALAAHFQSFSILIKNFITSSDSYLEFLNAEKKRQMDMVLLVSALCGSICSVREAFVMVYKANE